MNIRMTRTFKQAAKKLHKNQKPVLTEAVQTIQNNPIIGQLKIHDLAGVRIYKFHMLHQLILLAYTYEPITDKLILLNFGPHENFYRQLKA